ncbi:MAG: hypothetical protein ACTSV5_14815 [Promethearchaeota archaeon]
MSVNLNELSFRIIDDYDEILSYMQIGTKIPIWAEFHKYIIFDLKFFKAKSILLLESGNILGHVLVFPGIDNYLNFGYFGVISDSNDKISFLIEILIEYAKENNFKGIRGPVNIPIIIFGYGFMVEGSKTNLFQGRSVDSPNYLNLFNKSGFEKVNEFVTWEREQLLRFNSRKSKKYNFDNYKFEFPENLDDFNQNYKDPFLKLQAENLPLSASVTPNVAGVMDNYTDFVFKYGLNFMIFFIRDVSKDKLIACGAYIPNCLRRNEIGNIDSVYMYTWVVNKDYRREGIAYLMYGEITELLWQKGIFYGSGMISNQNKANTDFAIKRLGGIKTRMHVLLKYIIQ